MAASDTEPRKSYSTEEAEAISAVCRKGLTVVVLGASGDLAKKKTLPALYALFVHNLLPPKVIICGYARSRLSPEELAKMYSPELKKINNSEDKIREFLSRVSYVAGQYDSQDDFATLNRKLDELEAAEKVACPNRMFYLALPPSVFVEASRSFRATCFTSKGGWNRVIVEKPFGRDSETSKQLIDALSGLFTEEEQFRIDHYLGKEMVMNLMTLRFGNMLFQPLWNSNYIANVQITFKEPFGTEGRGGYFDDVGIIRDVMQNHLLQVLSIVAMERPVSLNEEDIRDEKVKVLRSIPPIRREDIVVGQYEAANGKPGYRDDKTVPAGSKCATFACAVLHVQNERWAGVPFFLKCGKALDDRKATIRIQLKDVPGQLFAGATRNEIVFRIQPDEAIYAKVVAKKPGIADGIEQTELDLTYKEKYTARLPEAYERLILAVVQGDHSLFVRADELEAAWKIFTPILHELEREGVTPEPYAYGSRGPASATEFVERRGFVRGEGYVWEPPKRSSL